LGKLKECWEATLSHSQRNSKQTILERGGAGLGMAVNPAKTRASVTLVKGP